MKILLHGHYGNKNIGDDALGYVFSKNVHTMFPNAELIIVSNDNIKFWTDDSVRRRIRLYQRSKINIIKAWLNADMIIYAGGTHFQDYGKMRDVKNNFSLIFKLLIAKILKKKIVFIGGSIGPLKTYTSKKLAKIGLLLSDKMWFRDKESLKWLGLSETSTDYLTDTVVMMSEINESKAEKTNSNVDKCLGVSTEYFFASAYGELDKDIPILNSVGSALKLLMDKEKELTIKFFAFQSNGFPSEDLDSIKYIINNSNLDRSRIQIVEYGELLNFINEINSCSHFLSYRLHSAVLAYSYGIPYISIEYHPKVKGFNDTVKLSEEARIDINNVVYSDLFNKLNKLLKNDIEKPKINNRDLSKKVQKKFFQSLSFTELSKDE